jgi:hypothetical protein
LVAEQLHLAQVRSLLQMTEATPAEALDYVSLAEKYFTLLLGTHDCPFLNVNGLPLSTAAMDPGQSPGQPHFKLLPLSLDTLPPEP